MKFQMYTLQMSDAFLSSSLPMFNSSNVSSRNVYFQKHKLIAEEWRLVAGSENLMYFKKTVLHLLEPMTTDYTQYVSKTRCSETWKGTCKWWCSHITTVLISNKLGEINCQHFQLAHFNKKNYSILSEHFILQTILKMFSLLEFLESQHQHYIYKFFRSFVEFRANTKPRRKE